MKNTLTTAEEAAATRGLHGRQDTRTTIIATITDIRKNSPHLCGYLTHPEIIIGLAHGRFGSKGLKRRLQEMCDADDPESEMIQEMRRENGEVA